MYSRWTLEVTFSTLKLVGRILTKTFSSKPFEPFFISLHALECREKDFSVETVAVLQSHLLLPLACYSFFHHHHHLSRDATTPLMSNETTLRSVESYVMRRSRSTAMCSWFGAPGRSGNSRVRLSTRAAPLHLPELVPRGVFVFFLHGRLR